MIVLVLTSKKDKKVDFVAVKEIPDSFVYEDCITAMDIIAVGYYLYIVMGLFNGNVIRTHSNSVGTIKFLCYKLEDDLGEDKAGAFRFFSRTLIFEETTDLQFPITSLNVMPMTKVLF